MPQSYQTIIPYGTKGYSLSISPYWVIVEPKGKQSKYIFSILFNNYFGGRIMRNEDGVWVPMDYTKYPSHPFELQSYDYQAIGEIIERELPDYV